MSKPSECFEDTTTERKLGSVVHGPRCFHPRVGLTNAGFKLPVLPLVSPDQLLNPFSAPTPIFHVLPLPCCPCRRRCIPFGPDYPHFSPSFGPCWIS